MSSNFGQKIKISIFGQSHGPAIGVVIDGLPAGELIDMDELSAFLARRAPGQSSLTTARRESDLPKFLSGILNGRTCGAPLSAIIENNDTRSSDYSKLQDIPRPAHADFPASVKYNRYNDVRGSGHFSARLTAPMSIARGTLKQMLKSRGVSIGAHIFSIADVCDTPFDPVTVSENDFLNTASKPLAVLNDDAGSAMSSAILSAAHDGDSVGGIIECGVVGLPVGIGEPMFDGLENRIAQSVFAVPAVKGIEFGAGFNSSKLRGSENNDPFCISDGIVRTLTNNHGGILGGLSSGMPLIFRAAFKPTPSIAKSQQSVNLNTGTEETLIIAGRHDPCVVPRAVPCIEAAAAIALADFLI